MIVTKVKITEMPVADPITGNELMEVVQDGENKKVLTSELFKAGSDGVDGKSAYQLAVDNGFTGTVLEWLFSLKGAQGATGKSAYEIAVTDGYSGTEAEWIASLKGIDGKTAYDIWINLGNTGTEQDFIASLKGEKGDKGDPGEQGLQGAQGVQGDAGAKGDQGIKGDTGDAGPAGAAGAAGADGKSAYQVAVDTGFIGTEQEWLDSLIGERGDPGQDGLDGQNYYDIGASLEGKPGAGQEILPSVRMGRYVIFEECSAGAKVAPTTEAVFSVRADDFEVATITFAAGFTTGVFDSPPGGVSFDAGTHISIVAPAVQDATLSGVGFVLMGHRFFPT